MSRRSDMRTRLASRLAAHDPDALLLYEVTDLYFDGDMEASVANTGQVLPRNRRPVAGVRDRSQDVGRDREALEAGRSRAGRGVTG